MTATTFRAQGVPEKKGKITKQQTSPTDGGDSWDIHPTTSAIPSATPTSMPTFGHHGIPRAQGAGLSL